MLLEFPKDTVPGNSKSIVMNTKRQMERKREG